MKQGDRAHVKPRDYNWHGNGAVGEVDHVDHAYGVYLMFSNGHTDYFNLEDVSLVSTDMSTSACPPDSKCRQK